MGNESEGFSSSREGGSGRGLIVCINVCVPTCLFNGPTNIPSRISRASSLWPTSSKASVASWPPTSRRTSSPPLLDRNRKARVSVSSLNLSYFSPLERIGGRVGKGKGKGDGGFRLTGAHR